MSVGTTVNQPSVAARDAVSLYRTMVTIRMFEQKAAALFAGGRLPGFLHLSLGQEAVAAGVCSVLDGRDLITTTHRGHGHCIAKGGEVEGMMAELFGRAEGYCKGRSGSMHIMDTNVGILGANAIVGGGIPMAAGAAFSARAQNDGRVAVSFFGEGAVAEGVFHEVLNLSALWALPIVFVVENNGYAELTHVSKHLSAENVADFAAPYGIPAEIVDGNDVLAVQGATERAVNRARRGEGPTLLECKTYRWHGHFEGDPQKYRSVQERDEWKLRDPILQFRARVTESGVISVAELEEIDDRIKDSVERAAEWAEGLPPAPIESLVQDVYTGAES
ncbi:thiamine pyrophosphate-dependent dehydrogenase E1 component subunit alpha [Intrasporangium calvum]|uniref:Pyruvate dehydrogenase (Acetyl-transferring) n=1 Tax=Intrasporangium calvum (strain ATCC 23552 / DSM 43043 / JCM 3097 / NBRC 12989 / NCIMB 10167 / NRRL B-3866 / 7 KIP) TaxID=710696 RepID=E6SCM0_INTC7|nr:thiamine pyrophosphate-dependent dehydrogenase E1 component subunit alpha [Intrasporangium calvum]ADU49624.1 Pyruvate dehydrogenase (acetyl-transferring) [Intrasporangium calvum DSM 43043]